MAGESFERDYLMTMAYVQYGCGVSAPRQWLNFEASRSLRRELEAAGFTGIRAARAGDSEEPMLGTVEDESRWVDAVGIQCYG